MPKSSGDFISEIRRRVRDTAGSNNTWTRQEILDAVIDAQREARGVFWQDAVYNSLQVSPSQHWYALPDYIRRINRIERVIAEDIALVSDSGAFRRELLYDWRHTPMAQTNRLWIGGNFPTSELAIYYEGDLAVFQQEMTLTTSIISTARVIPFNSSNGYFPAAAGRERIENWPVPGYLRIGDEVMYYDAVTQTSFTNVMRGMFGSGVATATSPFGLVMNSETLIQPATIHEYHESFDFITKKAIQHLFTQRLLGNDSEGNKTLGALAQQWGQEAAQAMQRDRQRRAGKTIQMRRRPRI